MRATAPSIKAVDVWDVLVTAITQAGSIGEVLDDLTVARIGYLDNINTALKYLFYNNFGALMDDITGLVVAGTATNPANALDNSLLSYATLDLIGETVLLTFEYPVFIKAYRIYGRDTANEDGVNKIEARVEGVWTDVLVGIPSRLGSWSAWADLTIQPTAYEWRFACTTVDTGDDSWLDEIEFRGVQIS